MAVVNTSNPRHSPFVTLTGEIDWSGSRQVSDVLTQLLQSGCHSPRVDLAGVSYMDSAGLLSVLRWCQQFRDQQGDLEVVRINPLVRRLFETAGRIELIDRSEESNLPPLKGREPVTDCLAIAGDLEIRAFSVKASLESCKIVRDRISQTTSMMPFSPDERADIKLAVGEAISNAIRHGCSGDPWETIIIRSLATSERLVVEISDPGLGFEPSTANDNLPEFLAQESGMGIGVMRRCMDEVAFEFSSEGTIVRLVKLVRK